MIKRHQNQSSEQEHKSEDSYGEDNQGYENDRDDDRRIQLEQDKDFFQKHGMFFCGTCKNIMDPHSTKGEFLQFRCKRCGIKIINFKNREDKKSMIHSRSLQSSSKKTELESRLIFDHSMPRMEVECPECGFHSAVYTVVPDESERKIVIKLICARGAEENVVKCDKKWDLDQDLQIYESIVEGALAMKDYQD